MCIVSVCSGIRATAAEICLPLALQLFDEQHRLPASPVSAANVSTVPVLHAALQRHMQQTEIGSCFTSQWSLDMYRD